MPLIQLVLLLCIPLTASPAVAHASDAGVERAATPGHDGTIHGTVRAESTGEPIAHATVEIASLGRRVLANDRGYFVLPGVPAGRWRIRASALGYRPHEVEIRLADGGSVQLTFSLAPRPVELSGVDVEAEAAQVEAVHTAGTPAVRVEGPALELVPGLAESDVFRALQTLPAIAAASDFSSALYVRGGSPDQNLITLDGMPLFNPYHLGGLFAALDPSTVGSVDVFTGGLPARTGDRLSSTIAIHTRPGRRDRIRGRGAIGLVSSRASVDGPLPGGDGSFLFSARRTYLDLITDAAFALNLIPTALPYGFTDAHLKLTHDVGRSGSVSASVYIDDEEISLSEKMREQAGGGDAQFDWGTRAATLRFRRPLSASWLGSVRIAWSEFYGSFEAVSGPAKVCDGSGCEVTGPPRPYLLAYTGIRDALARADLTWYHRRHELRIGAQLDAYRLFNDIPLFNESGEYEDFIPEFRRVSEPWTVAAYAEDEWRPTDALRLRAGLRMLYEKDRGATWLPRLGARIDLSERLRLSVGAGRYAQVLQSLINPESLTANLIAYDLLDAVPNESGFSTAEDVVLGVEWANESTSLRVDAYAKRMDGLLHPPIPDDILQASPIEPDSFLPASGTAHGLELYARHARGDMEFSLAYALSFADRRTAQDTFPPRFHRTHSLNATAAVPLGEGGVASARLALATGQPYTPAAGIAQPLRYLPLHRTFTKEGARRVILLDAHNSARLPGYVRLDVAARKSFRKHWFGRDVTLTPYLQVINVLNSKNVLMGVPQAYGRLGRPELEFAPQLPIVPTFGVEWRF